MRLFVAVVPPPAVLADLAAALAPYRAGRNSHDLGWTSPEDWHLTLAFLGEVPAATVDRLGPRLEQTGARHRPFPLALAGAGAFPSAGDARVLWCGLAGDRRALDDLATAVAAAATQAGATRPDAGRPFSPHLTLAYRGRVPADVRGLVAALSPYEGPPWPVDGLELIESRPRRRPRYTTIGRWPLDGDTL